MRTAALALALAARTAFAEDWPMNPWTLPANSLAALRQTVTSTVKSTVTVCPCVESTASVATAPHYTITGGYGHGVSSSPAGPDTSSSESKSTKTVEITVYSTILPVTETKVSSGTTYTKTYSTTSAYSTASAITSSVSKPAAYSASSGSETDVTKTIEVTKYTTTCPVTETTVSSGTTYTKTYSTVSTVTSSFTKPVSYSASSASESDVTKTIEVTSYTTTCPVTETTVSSGTTYTTTYSTVSTVTSTISKPVYYSASSGGSASPTSAVASTSPVSYSASSSESASATSAATSSASASYGASSSESVSSYGASSSESASSTSAVTSSASASYGASSSGPASLTTLTSYTTFTSLCTTEIGGSTTVETHTHSQPVYTTKTVSASATSTGTSSVYYSVPNGSGSLSSYGASGTGTAYSSGTSGTATPYSSGTAVSYSSSTVIPYSSGTVISYSSRASGTAYSSGVSGTAYSSGMSGTAYSSGLSSTATKSSSAVAPSGTGCVRCSGNPGDDAFCGYTIHDNYYQVVPNTCNTVEYDFTITDSTVAPDGISRPALIINNQMPGPKIEASWGDYIQVTVHNQMSLNGSSIHFHGMRQNYTNEMDGVPSITQCPLAPGESQTYKFRATSYGTSWYHSHFALQTYEGVFGPMIIHGPIDQEMTYDGEEMLLLQDWSHATVDELFWPSQVVQIGSRGGAPTLDTGLINGVNVWGDDGSSSQSGSRFEMTVTQGQTYRLRLVNTAIASTFKFYIDGHKFKVFTTDFVPIVPYETDILNINIGQRYDILVTFDQPVGNYWLRSDNQASCNTILQQGNIKGIVRYAGATSTLPTSTAYTYTDECVDEPIASLVPILALDAGSVTKTVDESILIGATGGSPNLYKWSLSGTTFQSQWGAPTLQQIYENGTAPSYSGSLAIDVPTLGEWVYVIIDTPIPVTHPIHLHGHDFMILAQGTGFYTNQPLNTKNPARRDVVNMPAGRGTGGYVVIAWQADNPGAWLLVS